MDFVKYKFLSFCICFFLGDFLVSDGFFCGGYIVMFFVCVIVKIVVVVIVYFREKGE